MAVGRLLIQRHHNSQVVEKSDGAGDYQDQDQRPGSHGRAGRNDVELAEKTCRQRDTGERKQHGREDQRERGPPPEQPAVVFQLVRIAVLLGENA